MHKHALTIALLAMAATLTGCASRGDDQNYRVLQDDTPILQRETGEPRSQRHDEQAMYFVALQDDVTVNPIVPQANADPSGVMDRSHWSATYAGPADGRTWHGPVYFKDRRYYVESPDVLAEGTRQRQIEAALEDGRGTLSAVHVTGLVVEPINFALGIVLLPARMVLTPPWEKVSTPVREPVVTHGVVVLVEPQHLDAMPLSTDSAVRQMEEALD